MWKKLLLLIVALLIVAAIVWHYLKPEPPTAVNVIEPAIQDLRTTLDLNAVVVNTQTVTITALLNGEIGNITAREGMLVEPGATLAELNNERAQSVLDKTTAEFSYSEEKLKSATRNYSRIKNLSGAGNASKQALDESLDALKSAESALAVSQANVKLAELEFKNAKVNAPFAGVITQHFTEAGQWVEAGTPLFELAATDGYLIEAQVDASDWSLVNIEQAVFLTTESAPDKQWESTVSWIAPTVERNDRNAKAVAIRFEFGDDAPQLLLGQEIDAELVLEQVEDVLTLGLSDMLETEPNEYAVFVSRDDKAKLIPVELGLQNATHAQILSGIEDDDKLIRSINGQLEDNMPIEIH